LFLIYFIKEEIGREERIKIEKKSKDENLRNLRAKRDRDKVLIKVLG